nr:hypothetical protein [Cressdnaviricota sp.]
MAKTRKWVEGHWVYGGARNPISAARTKINKWIFNQYKKTRLTTWQLKEDSKNINRINTYKEKNYIKDLKAYRKWFRNQYGRNPTEYQENKNVNPNANKYAQIDNWAQRALYKHSHNKLLRTYYKNKLKKFWINWHEGRPHGQYIEWDPEDYQPSKRYAPTEYDYEGDFFKYLPNEY